MAKQSRDIYITQDPALNYILARIAARLDTIEGLLPDMSTGLYRLGSDKAVSTTTIRGTDGQIQASDDLVLSLDSPLKIGDADAGNYTEIEDDGTIAMHGDATVWDDMRIVPGSFDRPGASDPAIKSYAPGGAGTATYLYEFALNNIVSFTVQLPHNYKQGSDIYAHVHWTPAARGATENGNYVGWKLDYEWVNIHGVMAGMATLDLSSMCNGIDHRHEMSTDVVITGTDKGISSMLLCNFKRTDTGTDDTWTGAGTGNLPLLLEIDFHYEINTIGSRERASK